MEPLKIEYVPIDSIKPYSRNAKLHPQEQVEQIANSIREFGFRQPMVIDKDGVLVIGHGRLLAAKKLGLDAVPCVRADDLTEDQIKALRLVDNKTNESEWDFDILPEELDSISDFDMQEFGFELNIDFSENQKAEDFFSRENRNDTSKEEGNEEYNDFIEKFEAKKTTDDCYTPEVIYDSICDWVCSEYGVNRSDFVRPFYPGGDYQAYQYPQNSIVVDNPPFSILAEIVNYYSENNIKFFLFAPTLTLFSSSSSSSACSICVGVEVTYENGATVNTSFLTNMEESCRLRSAPTLYRAVKDANDKNLKELHRELPKYTFPDYVITSTRCGQFSRYGIDFRVPVSESAHIRQLDEQKETGKGIFGSGYLLSERLKELKEKAEREKAEREKAEREKAERWELSEREMEIVKGLSFGKGVEFDDE